MQQSTLAHTMWQILSLNISSRQVSSVGWSFATGWLHAELLTTQQLSGRKLSYQKPELIISSIEEQQLTFRQLSMRPHISSHPQRLWLTMHFRTKQSSQVYSKIRRSTSWWASEGWQWAGATIGRRQPRSRVRKVTATSQHLSHQELLRQRFRLHLTSQVQLCNSRLSNS